jgi:hypothetical protein
MVLGLLTGIQLMAAPMKAKQTVKVVIGKHPPQAGRVAAETAQIIKNWCPVLAGWLGKELDKPVEMHVEFVNDPKGDIAWASGNTITMNFAKTLHGSNIDDGILIHEQTHVIQPYPDSVPGWLVEGIADYNRWVRYEPHNWESGSIAGVSYKDRYGWAADFLGWVERHYDRKLVQAIHAQACAGKYTNDLFRKWTKKTPDRLWAEYFEARKAPGGGRAFRLENVRSGLPLGFHGPEPKVEAALMAVSRNQGQLWRLEKVKGDFVDRERRNENGPRSTGRVPRKGRAAHRHRLPRHGEPAVADGALGRTLPAPVEVERPVRQRLRRAAGRRSTSHSVAETPQAELSQIDAFRDHDLESSSPSYSGAGYGAANFPPG